MRALRAGSVAFALLAAACGSGGGGGGAGGPTAPAASGAATPGANGEVSENLTFTGAISGTMTSGQRGNTYVCTGGALPGGLNTLASGGALTIGPIAGQVGSSWYGVNFTKLGYQGPGTFSAEGVVQIMPLSAPDAPPGDAAYVASTGTLTVNSDGRSGSVDTDLTASQGSGTAHVRGTWTCPPDF